MKTRRSALWCLAVFALAALTISPTAMGRPRKKKAASTETLVVAGSKSGTSEINPTNISVLDDDFAQAALVAATEEQLALKEALPVVTGRGIVVAVLDGGFNLRHPDIAGSISPLAYDAVDLDDDPSDPGNGFDDDGDGVTDRALGHGTFVAGMVLQTAPDATILPIRVVDDEGYGTAKEFLRGLEYAIDAGADVINYSLEVDGLSWAHAKKLHKRAVRKDIICVASAGNSGSEEYGVLAAMVSTLSAGAVDYEDRIAVFSNFDVDALSETVFAPGVDVHGPIGFPEDDSSGVWSGTSFSAGIISGAVALARELHPTWDGADLRDLVQTSVDPVYDSDGFVIEGAGRINLEKLVSR